MGHLERLPGIEERNTTRRNALVTALYALGGIAVLGTVLESAEDDSPPEQAMPAELHAVSQQPDWLQNNASFSGSGQTVTEPFEAVRFTTFIYDHAGSGDFVLELVDAGTGDSVATLLEERGPTAGAVGIGLSSAQYSLEIEADGDWSIELGEPLASEEGRDEPPATIAGEGSNAFGKVIVGESVSVTARHEGESEFVVSAWDEANTRGSPDVRVFDERGEFDGEASIEESGLFYITVEADGPYQIEIG